MLKILKNKNFYKNIFFRRVFSIKKSIFLYGCSSLLDIFIILRISLIFDEISQEKFMENIISKVFICFLLITLRTIFVFLLRKYSFKNIFEKKVKDENFILNKFVNARIKNENNSKSLNSFKEKLINSCNLAVINFDIPIVSIFAEIIFAIGGVLILFKTFGIELFLINLPVFIILILFSRFISKKLKNLGRIIIDLTEKRLNIIDNISEIAMEVFISDNSDNLKKYFNKLNKPYNKVLGQQIIFSNILQITTESTAFIIILVSLICLLTNISQTSLANAATSLAVLSRMVPSFTRSIAFITQLQFGIPCVIRLSEIVEDSC